MRFFGCFLLSFLVLFTVAQEQSGGPFIHSHNDYEQEEPLFGALESRAKSIEIDVFLQKGELFVAHTKKEIKETNTLESQYILPLQKYLSNTKEAHDFHFMIDIKTEAVATLNEIQLKLNEYPNIFSTEGVQVVISGNRPNPKNYNDYANYIWFDGRSPRDAMGVGGDRISIISQNLSKFTHWRGEGEISTNDKDKLNLFIKECHAQNKSVRLWNTGDSKVMYEFLYKMKVDYINTDFPSALSQYLNERKIELLIKTNTK